jgi:hypothetical protein
MHFYTGKPMHFYSGVDSGRWHRAVTPEASVRSPGWPTVIIRHRFEIGLSVLGPLFPPSKLSFLCCEGLAFSPLRTADPPLCQTTPVWVSTSAARQFGHGFAICGKLQELLRRAHRRGSCSFLRTIPPSRNRLRRIAATRNLPFLDRQFSQDTPRLQNGQVTTLIRGASRRYERPPERRSPSYSPPSNRPPSNRPHPPVSIRRHHARGDLPWRNLPREAASAP